MISALPNDALTAFHQVQQLGMTGEGWVWLVSDKVASAPLRNEPALKEAMNGLVGLTVKAGSGAKYLDLLVLWLQKEEGKYPGVIWSYDVRKIGQRSLPKRRNHQELTFHAILFHFLDQEPQMSLFAPQVYNAVSAYFKAFDKLARKGIIQPVGCHCIVIFSRDYSCGLGL